MLIGKHGTLVLLAWRSIRQTGTALSTVEAELAALQTAMRLGLMLLDFLESIRLNAPFVLLVDNDQARAAANSGYSKSLKYVKKSAGICISFLHHCVTEQLVEILRVDSERNTSDIMTKPVAAEAFWLHVRSLGVRPFGSKREFFPEWILSSATKRWGKESWHNSPFVQD